MLEAPITGGLEALKKGQMTAGFLGGFKSRAGHLRYFFIFSIIKNDFFAFF